jgi:hypothetical protein
MHTCECYETYRQIVIYLILEAYVYYDLTDKYIRWFHSTYCHMLGLWLIRRGLDCMIGFIASRYYARYSAIAILHTFQFTADHTLGFSVFTSRILATDLSQSHCNFKSHVKSSCHSLIPKNWLNGYLYSLLEFMRQLHLLLYRCLILVAANSEYSTQLDYSRFLLYTPSRLLTVPSYNSSARTPWKTQSLLMRRPVDWSIA